MFNTLTYCTYVGDTYWHIHKKQGAELKTRVLVQYIHEVPKS
jgi:hypothetical protein